MLRLSLTKNLLKSSPEAAGEFSFCEVSMRRFTAPEFQGCLPSELCSARQHILCSALRRPASVYQPIDDPLNLIGLAAPTDLDVYQ